MSKAVVDGVLQSVSASQITTFQMCPRRWFYQKVLGFPDPETEDQADGTRIHKQMEDWYLHGLKPEHASCQKALLLPEVPARSPELLVEEPRNYDLGLRLAGIPVRGRIDLQGPLKSRRFRVWDWKSSKKLQYLKTPDELNRNPQGLIYLEHEFQKYPDALLGDFGHIYIGKQVIGAKAVFSDAMTRDQVAEGYGLLEVPVREMQAISLLKNPLDVPYDVTESACGKFPPRGCPYADVCPRGRANFSIIDWADEPESITEVQDLSTLSEKLKARKAATQTPDPLPLIGQVAKDVNVGQLATGINPPDAAPNDIPVPFDLNKTILERTLSAEADLRATTATPILATGPTTGTQTPVQGATTSTAPVGLTLMIGCAPRRSTTFTELSAEIARRTPAILETLRKNSPKDVPADAVDLREVKFGQGTTALCASFKKDPPSGVVVASPVGLSGTVLEVLEPLASEIIRPL